MTTSHAIAFQSASTIPADDASVDLVVTSPPYPMIEMWDGSFAAQDDRIAGLIASGDGGSAYEAMHALLDAVWRECARVLRPGGFVCVNVGDATRSLAGNFRLYANHARITVAMEALGLQSLPAILWRKQTNAPNKFMGSGMLPVGAYVTLEHEYVLVFRKGDRREFTGADRERRRASAFFWEERNEWFSDLWEFKGARQRMADEQARGRSGAFPFELPFRLVNMYSARGDLVLDPFAGTGTTMLAAMAAGRSSLGVEVDPRLADAIEREVGAAGSWLNERQARRLRDHREFVERSAREGKRALKHENEPHAVAVVTSQETQLSLPAVESVTRRASCSYVAEHAQSEELARSIDLRDFPAGIASARQLDLNL